MVYTPDSQTPITAGTSGTLQIRDAATGALNYIVFFPDGRRLASGGTDTDVTVWRLDPDSASRQVCENLSDAISDDLDAGCG